MNVDPTTQKSIEPPFTVIQPSKEEKLDIVIYGHPGVGKTTLAATAVNVESLNNVLFLDIDKGTLSISDPKVAGINKFPDIVRLDGDKATEKMRHFEKIVNWLIRREHSYKTFVVDTFSELTKISVDKMLLDNVNAGRARLSEYDIQLKDYGDNNKYLAKYIRLLRDSKLNVIWLCHSEYREDENQQQRLGPSISPGILDVLNKNVSIIGNLITREVESEEKKGKETIRTLLFSPVGNRVTKDRTPGGKLGRSMDNPTFEKIISRIQGE